MCRGRFHRSIFNSPRTNVKIVLTNVCASPNISIVPRLQAAAAAGDRNDLDDCASVVVNTYLHVVDF